MKNIKVQKSLDIKEISTLVKSLLTQDERITSDCLVESASSRDTKMMLHIGISFDGFVDAFRIVATNKRVLFIKLARTINKITGINEYEYDEFKSIAMDEKMRHIKLKFTDGGHINLTTIDITDKPEIIENTKKTFNHIISIIGEDKVEKTTYLTGAEMFNATVPTASALGGFIADLFL